MKEKQKILQELSPPAKLLMYHLAGKHWLMDAEIMQQEPLWDQAIMECRYKNLVVRGLDGAWNSVTVLSPKGLRVVQEEIL